MAKKMRKQIEDGETATSVALGCATFLDAGLAEQLGAASEREAGLDCGGQLAVRVAQRMRTLRLHLETASDAVGRIKSELTRLRKRRDDAHAELYDSLKHLRQYLRGIFAKDEGDTFLGLRGTLPREPKDLRDAVRSILGRLADASWQVPESRVDGLGLGREGVLKKMRQDFHELDTTLTAIKDGETQLALARAARKRIASLHAAFSDKSARFLEAAFELAGLDEIAATVRPGVGRLGRPLKEGTQRALSAANAALELPAAELLKLAPVKADEDTAPSATLQGETPADDAEE